MSNLENKKPPPSAWQALGKREEQALGSSGAVSALPGGAPPLVAAMAQYQVAAADEA